MQTIKVSDMMCKNCVKKIDTALKRHGIVSTISLENKTVEVEDDKLEQAKEIITSTGFKAE